MNPQERIYQMLSAALCPPQVAAGVFYGSEWQWLFYTNFRTSSFEDMTEG